MPDRDQSYSSNRGFASMDQQRQREIASKGGQASGGNFKNDPERASEAGRKGGQSVPAEERSFSRDPGIGVPSWPQRWRDQPRGCRCRTRRTAGRLSARDRRAAGEARRDGRARYSGTQQSARYRDRGRSRPAPRRTGHAGGPSHPATERGQVKPGGTVGREIPEHSKAHDTEIAVEAGRHGGGPKDQNR